MAKKPKPKVAASLRDQISETINSLLVVKARLPPILDLIEELKVVARGQETTVRNGIVLQMARDSFDMLVIDLASLREGMVRDEGILNQLRHHLALFAEKKPEDFEPPAVGWVGEPDPKGIKAVQAHEQRQLARGHAAAIKRLFPRGAPVTDADIDDLIKRFRDETKAIDDDRNKVRAHRFEVPSDLATKFYLVPTQVEGEIQRVERYLNDLLLVLEGSVHAMNALEFGNRKDASEGLADLIVWGGINEACMRYGLTPRKRPPETESAPWYWAKRNAYLEKAAHSSLSDDEELGEE